MFELSDSDLSELSDLLDPQVSSGLMALLPLATLRSETWPGLIGSTMFGGLPADIV